MGLGQVGLGGGFRETVNYKVFGADSAFRLGWCTTGVVQFSAFQWFLLGLGEFWFWRGYCILGYRSVGFGHFPDIS